MYEEDIFKRSIPVVVPIFLYNPVLILLIERSLNLTMALVDMLQHERLCFS